MFYINNQINTVDKYDLSKFIEMGDDGAFDPLNSYFLYMLPTLPTVNFYTVRLEAGRPDLLSNSIYGATQYWWILMHYNHMIKPQDIKVGMSVRYPSLSAIEQLYRDLSLRHKTENK